MIVREREYGRYYVYVGETILAGPFDSNSEAWRWVDLQEVAPVSKSEDTRNWRWSKFVHGE